jgi:hypothetical protein
MSHWIINEENTIEKWLELRDSESRHVAIIRQDGSVHLGNGNEYFKIDNLQDMIERLQDLTQHAKNYFGEWPK